MHVNALSASSGREAVVPHDGGAYGTRALKLDRCPYVRGNVGPVDDRETEFLEVSPGGLGEQEQGVPSLFPCLEDYPLDKKPTQAFIPHDTGDHGGTQ